MNFEVRRADSCRTIFLTAVLGCATAVSGCKSGSGQTAPAQATQAPATSSVAPPATAPNQAPTISGSPGATVAIGQKYTFVAAAADADGDALGFSIANRPAWAEFDTATGRLTGTPAAANVGAYPGIQISVSDGKATVALTTFTLSVTGATALAAPAPAPAVGTATLAWSPPTENVDGSSLTNLSGFRIRYGTTADQLTQEITISNSAATTYTVTALAPATYFFAIQAINTAGAESLLSAVASKTIT